MVTLRQLTGWIALVIASVGPMPLWAHHALCHVHRGCESACQAHVGHSHADPLDVRPCGHQHPAFADQADDLADQRPPGLYGTSDPHDCAICYHLSQSASSTGIISVDCALLPPIESLAAADKISIATLCGWPAPRGPPAVV